MPQSGYGMTETCSHQYTLPTDDPKLIVETSGRACPGYELRIFSTDDPDVEAPPGEVGQIGGRGASLMLGYFDDQTATEDAFNAQGWFMTGDLGSLDDNGYLRISRPQEGHHHPRRPQHPSRAHRGAGEPASRRSQRVAAVPVKDTRLGEKVCLAVMFRAGQAIEPGELLAHLDAAGLSKFDMPEYFLALDEIPLTPNGKMRKRDLVDWIAQGRVTPQPIRFEAKRASA